MAHYAFIDENNTVVEVIVGRDEDDLIDGVDDWETYYSTKRDGMTAVRTSYNTRAGVHYDPETGDPSEDQSKAFRGNYAGLGMVYYFDADVFAHPQPYPSWTLDPACACWVAPMPKPADGAEYEWDEEAGEWVAE